MPGPDVILPCAVLAAFGFLFLRLALDTSRADPVAYSHLQRRARSPRDVVLGLVTPGENYAGGMAYKRTAEGKIIIVRTCQITKADLDAVYGR